MQKNIFIRRLVCVVLLGISALSCFSQTEHPSSAFIPGTLLKKDFLLLRDTLEKSHPGMYRYKTKKEIDHVFDSCYASIKDSMSMIGFYKLTRFAIASIEDGHSNCKLPEPVMNDFVSNAKVFPAMVLFINSRAYIFCCKQNAALTGAEILSINGKPAAAIIQKMFSFIPSDAGITSRKNWELPEFFHLLYNALYGEQNHFDIDYRLPDRTEGKTRLQPDIIKNIFCSNPFPRPKKYLELSYHPGGIAVLSIKTFFDGFLQQTGENFHAFLDSAFTDIKKKGTKKLLIDLRRNQGGNDANGALLYAYLTQKPFSYYASLETTHEQFTSGHHSLLSIQQPEKNNFAGKVYVLADGRSFSASAEFAAIAKSNQRAIFLGEENGGGYYGNTSGDDLMLLLPNSQISCRVPLIKYTVAVKKSSNKGLGILPDYPLYPSITDIIQSKDGEMDEALKIVKVH